MAAAPAVQEAVKIELSSQNDMKIAISSSPNKNKDCYNCFGLF